MNNQPSEKHTTSLQQRMLRFIFRNKCCGLARTIISSTCDTAAIASYQLSPKTSIVARLGLLDFTSDQHQVLKEGTKAIRAKKLTR